MRTAAIEDGTTMNIGTMDTCTEPMDPFDSRMQDQMEWLEGLSAKDRDAVYHDIGTACLRLCGAEAENVTYLNPELAEADCLEIRSLRAALVASGAYIEPEDIIGADELDRIPDLQVKIVD